MILKPNMVQPGKDHPVRASAAEIAAATIRLFRRTVPAAVPSINFLSGGQSDEEATANLNALNAHAEKQPWQLSFSYGRALQAAALKAWHGEAANLAAAQQALFKRARLNGLLSLQEAISLGRNRAWFGRSVEVLVDQSDAPGGHDHGDSEGGHRSGDAAPVTAGLPATVALPGAALPALAPGEVRLAGRTRQGKLVHLAGPADLVGTLVTARVVHAGPFSLRGILV